MLAPVVQDAIAYWAGQGVTAESLSTLGQLEVRVADFSGSLLGMASMSNLVWIDLDAADYGWRIDFSSALAGGIDLLSAVTHELGHKLGFEHDDPHDVMAPTLASGVRPAGTLFLPQRLAALDYAYAWDLGDDGPRLGAILHEWTSDRDHATRVDNLRGTGSGDRWNGDIFLKTQGEEATVFDDGVRDLLTGSEGLDWFIFNDSEDKATDLSDEEFANFLDFIMAAV